MSKRIHAPLLAQELETLRDTMNEAASNVHTAMVTYAARDSEHGVFALQHHDPIPYEDDPSLWSSFEMEGALTV